MSVVRTVTGNVAPEAIGPTLMHEHVLCDLTQPDRRDEPEVEITPQNAFEVRYHWDRHVGNHRLLDRSVAADELRRFRKAGGRTVVELTSEGIAPDPEGLAAVSRQADVLVVRGCGTYVAAYAGEALTAASVDALAERMVRAIRDEGAGIIGEIGLSDPPHPAERRALQAAAIASRETGAAVNVHPPRDAAGVFEAVDLFVDTGGDPERLVLSHMDRTFAGADEPSRLADRGVVVEWDFFGINDAHYPYAAIDLPHDGGRLDIIRTMIDRGHLTRVALSQDICTKSRLTRWGGHGYAHLLTNVVPMMRRRSFAEEEIDALLVATPRRLLAIDR